MMNKIKQLLPPVKMTAAVASLLVLFSTLVAGAINIKTRVSALESRQLAITARFEHYCERQSEALEKIKESLQTIALEQALLRQRIDILLRTE